MLNYANNLPKAHKDKMIYQRLDEILTEGIELRLFSPQFAISLHSLQGEIASDYAYRTERFELARKSIVQYNQLVKELFSGKEGEMGVDFEQLQRGTHMYFVTSKSKSSFSFRRSSNYFNIGRSKKEDKWKDVDLSLVFFPSGLILKFYFVIFVKSKDS